MKGINDCTYEEFQYALSVGITAPFYLVKLLKPHLNKDASIVNICSTRAAISQAQTESYSAAKGGVHALTHAMAVSLSGIARVNAISLDGLTLQIQTLKVQMHTNILQDALVNPKISHKWSSFYVQMMQHL